MTKKELLSKLEELRLPDSAASGLKNNVLLDKVIKLAEELDKARKCWYCQTNEDKWKDFKKDFRMVNINPKTLGFSDIKFKYCPNCGRKLEDK